MKARVSGRRRGANFMVLGVGAFAQSLAQILKEAGAKVSTYLTRNYGHFPPSLAGPTYTQNDFPNPNTLFKAQRVNCVLPQSIDWAQAPWGEELRRARVPIFSPVGEAMRIERERDFARRLCGEFKIPFPQSYVASNRLEAEKILAAHPQPFVIKNPLCSPTSPVHTIVCESTEDTRAWLKQVNYAEGVFLQEYLGRAEAGHIALVSGGEIYSLVTNQEYKRAFNGNMGIIAGAPMGGLVERDETDRHDLAKQLIHPLLPWLRRAKFNGPLQVTAVRRKGQWEAIEYNIRIGVTSGPMILRMLANPAETVLATALNEKLEPRFKSELRFGCSVTLAGYGYPYVQVRGPQLPMEIEGKLDCDVWWNEVARDGDGNLFATGHRIADVIALGSSLEASLDKVYRNIRKLRVLGSFFRTDIGQSLWPPGRE